MLVSLQHFGGIGWEGRGKNEWILARHKVRKAVSKHISPSVKHGMKICFKYEKN